VKELAMGSGGTYVTEPTSQHHFPIAPERDSNCDLSLDEVRASLKNLRYGSVTIIVQDGVIIQIDRTEKRRLQSRRAVSREQ
jgi:hypothetical protein